MCLGVYELSQRKKITGQCLVLKRATILFLNCPLTFTSKKIDRHNNISLYSFKSRLSHRSTPVECLHTILLGPYKYLTSNLMERLSDREKEVASKLTAFSWSGLPSTLSPEALCHHHKSLIGRDYKLVAQVALYILWDHLTGPEKEVWKALSKVGYYCFATEQCRNYNASTGVLSHLLHGSKVWGHQ